MKPAPIVFPAHILAIAEKCNVTPEELNTVYSFFKEEVHKKLPLRFEIEQGIDIHDAHYYQSKYPFGKMKFRALTPAERKKFRNMNYVMEFYPGRWQYFTTSAIKELHAKLEELFPRWISVDDEMPKENSEVLVSFKESNTVMELDYSSAYFNQKGFWSNENGGEYQHDYNSEVSHWQYLPESANKKPGDHDWRWKDSVMKVCEDCYLIKYPGRPVRYVLNSKPIDEEVPCDKEAQLKMM